MISNFWEKKSALPTLPVTGFLLVPGRIKLIVVWILLIGPVIHYHDSIHSLIQNCYSASVSNCEPTGNYLYCFCISLAIVFQRVGRRTIIHSWNKMCRNKWKKIDEGMRISSKMYFSSLPTDTRVISIARGSCCINSARDKNFVMLGQKYG